MLIHLSLCVESVDSHLRPEDPRTGGSLHMSAHERQEHAVGWLGSRWMMFFHPGGSQPELGEMQTLDSLPFDDECCYDGQRPWKLFCSADRTLVTAESLSLGHCFNLGNNIDCLSVWWWSSSFWVRLCRHIFITQCLMAEMCVQFFSIAKTLNPIIVWTQLLNCSLFW